MEKIYDVIIIGAGISGLSAAHFIKKSAPSSEVMLLEASGRAGGAIQSFHQDGFLAEWGPHGFLDNAAESREILEDTGLYSEAQQAPLGDFHRYVCHRGRLVQIPQKPNKILFTPLLPFWGKLRMLGDLWIKPDPKDQSLGQWAGRRFGKSVLPLVDAAVTGSYSGDFNLLSIDSIMPGLRKLECEHGSVIRALIGKMKEKKGSVKKRLPAMNNFPQGLDRLVEVLVQGKNIAFDSGVTAINRVNDQWRITTAKEMLAAKNVVMALPVNSGLKILSAIKKPPIAQIPVSRICNVVLGFDASAKVPYGFGYLAPECERRFTLGVLFSSHMFPNRAPEGKVLMEALVGGRRHPERLELSDQEIISSVCQDIRQLMELPEKPLFAKVLRPASAIPQLEMDHPKMLTYRAGLEQENKGLYICGFGWDGVGINDMVKSARKAAVAISAGSRGEEAAAPVKPVYF